MTRKRSKPKKPLSEKQRESDERLREELRHADLKKLDKALDKALGSQKTDADRR